MEFPAAFSSFNLEPQLPAQCEHLAVFNQYNSPKFWDIAFFSNQKTRFQQGGVDSFSMSLIRHCLSSQSMPFMVENTL